MKTILLILLTALTLSACTTVNRASDWPESIPPKSYYIDYYATDIEHQHVLSLESYLVWIKRFYLGWELYSLGWLDVAEDVALTVDEKERAKIKAKVLAIGKLVSPEWAKNKNHRVINTRHLGLWGSMINESIVRKEQEIMLDRIHADVIALLDRNILPEEITESRYYIMEVFGGDF